MKDILMDINKLIHNKFKIQTIIESNKNDILVCLMCLLHSHKFQLFDNSIADCTLAVERQSPNEKIKLMLIANVEIVDKVSFAWPVMSLNIDIENYIQNLAKYNFDEKILFNLNNYNAVRDNLGNLIIKGM